MTLRRITRDRRLSQDEATKYREVRARVEEELPELIGRHHERIRNANADVIGNAEPIKRVY